MIDVQVKPHEDGELAGKYDVYVYAAENGELLMFSKQGYDNRSEAEWMAVRAFAAANVVAEFVGVSPVDGRQPEPVRLSVFKANGCLERERTIR